MPKICQSLPKKDGYRMPAEFEKHIGTYLLWPERTDNWRNGAKPAQRVFANVAKKISEYENVVVGVSNEQYENARGMLDSKISVIEISNNDSWIRDCGPTKVINGEGKIRNVSWKFNAWGGLVDGLYFPWNKDDKVAEKISNIQNNDYYQAPIILEGGSIHVDGEGTIYTTEACLLSKGRNPNLTKKEIENYLKSYLGGEKVIWLPRGIYNDETNEHVDNIIQIVEPGHVLLHWTYDKNDVQYELSKQVLNLLESSTDAKGRKIKVTKLIAPNPLIIVTNEEAKGVDVVNGTLPRKEGDRMAASYINHLIINGAVIAPSFGIPTDLIAKETLQKAYPNRKIEMIKNAREIILGGGNIHCITQQY